MERYDFIVVGATTDGLLAAALMAQAGRSVLVLDDFRDARVEQGTDSYVWPPSDRMVYMPGALVNRLDLTAVSKSLISPKAEMTVAQNAPPLIRFANPHRTAQHLESVSPRDASAYLEYCTGIRRARDFLFASLHLISAPSREGDAAAASERADLRPDGAHVDSTFLNELWRLMTMPLDRFLVRSFDSPAVRAALRASAQFHAPCEPVDPLSACTAQTVLNDPLIAASMARTGDDAAAAVGGLPSILENQFVPGLIDAVARFGGAVKLDARITDLATNKDGSGLCHVDGLDRPLECSVMMLADLQRQARVSAKSSGEAAELLGSKSAAAPGSARPDWLLTFEGPFATPLLPGDLRPFAGWVYCLDDTDRTAGAPLGLCVQEVRDSETGAWRTHVLARLAGDDLLAPRAPRDDDQQVAGVLEKLCPIWPHAKALLAHRKKLNAGRSRKQGSQAAVPVTLSPLTAFAGLNRMASKTYTAPVLHADGVELFTGMGGALAVIRQRLHGVTL